MSEPEEITPNTLRNSEVTINGNYMTVAQLREITKGLPPHGAVRIHRDDLNDQVTFALAWRGWTYPEIGQEFDTDMLEDLAEQTMQAALEIELQNDGKTDEEGRELIAIVTLPAHALSSIVSELLARRDLEA